MLWSFSSWLSISSAVFTCFFFWKLIFFCSGFRRKQRPVIAKRDLQHKTVSRSPMAKKRPVDANRDLKKKEKLDLMEVDSFQVSHGEYLAKRDLLMLKRDLKKKKKDLWEVDSFPVSHGEYLIEGQNDVKGVALHTLLVHACRELRHKLSQQAQRLKVFHNIGRFVRDQQQVQPLRVCVCVCVCVCVWNLLRLEHIYKNIRIAYIKYIHVWYQYMYVW